MPKITMEWDLTKDDNYGGEKEDMERCMRAGDLCACIEDLRELIARGRSNAEKETWECEDPESADYKHWDKIYNIHDNMLTEYFEILESHSINMDKLWS